MKILNKYAILSVLLLPCLASFAQQWNDVTDIYIKNPCFDGNDVTTGWEGDAFSAYNPMENAEHYEKNYDTYQDIEGLTPGKYRLSLDAFYRMGSASNDYSLYSSNSYSSSQHAKLYATSSLGDYQVSIKPASSGKVSESLGGDASSVGNSGGWWWGGGEYIPNNMEAAHYWFEANKYPNTIECQVGSDGKLRIGVRKTTTISSDWTCLDNFKLEFYGTISVAESHKPNSENTIINEICAANIDVYRDPSTNFGPWVELYNPTDNDLTLGGLYVSDDPQNLRKNRLVSSYGKLGAHGFAVLNFDHHEIYTVKSYRQIDDKLNLEGGTIIISDGENIIAQQDYPRAIPRTSYARTTDGGDTWGITAEPTPLKTNTTSTFASQQLAAPVVDTDGKIFSSSFRIKVNIPSGTTLRYTTNGTTPTLTNGTVSNDGTFTVSATTCYRFRLFQDGKLPSTVVTRSYIKSTNEPFPVISVVTDQDNIDASTNYGLFNKGTYGRPGSGQSTNCNWNMAWDRPVSFEYFTTDGECTVAQECNFSMCGGWSRAWTPHSFKLKASEEFDFKKTFEAQFFDEKPYVREKTLQIRNGGNDTSCRIKDPALQQIAARSGFYVDYQAWQPVHVYINGKSHAVLNMREPNNKHHAYANYGLSTDEMDQFEICPDSGYIQMEGTVDAFNRLYNLSKNADGNGYSEILKLVDIDEYINYMAIELYLGATDWPQNNTKGYRSRNDGKFHFVLFDLDGALATTTPLSTFAGKQNYTFDRLYGYDYSQGKSLDGTRLTMENKFVTIFLNLLKNETFKKQFIDTFCLVVGSIYTPERVTAIVNEMATYMKKGSYVNPDNTASNIKSSLSSSRQTSLISHIQSYFSLPNSKAINATLSSNVPEAAMLLNGMEIPTGKFSGKLFSPITLTAVTPAGYRFLGWTSDGIGDMTTKTVFAGGTTWKYYDSQSLDGKDWKSASYTETSWKSGASPLGYGKNDIKSTTTSGKTCYYFRKTISLSSVADAYALNWVADDGFVIYVNGVEAGRYNMSKVQSPKYSDVADTFANGNPDSGTLDLDPSLFKVGSNIIAVEVHNNNSTSTDIYWDATLIEATAKKGEGASYLSTDPEYTLPTSGTVTLKAVYEKLSEAETAARGIAPVRINEVSAGNDIFMNDHFRRNDWVELYNTTDEDYDLSGMFLSDDPKNPHKYEIPTGELAIVPARGYIVIWCDTLSSISQLHAPFKLDNADGAVLTLQAADGTWEDRFEYLAQPRFHTFGRYPDGANSLSLLSIPSIGKTNKLAKTYDSESIYDDEQTIITLALNKGWNWTSHNLAASVDRSRFTNYAGILRSQTSELYNDSRLGWVGGVRSLNPAEGYKIKMNEAADITLRGQLFDSQTPVTLGKGWNWTGFPLYNATTLSVALQNYKASEGDVIVGHTAFATFEKGEWGGTLTTLTPGQAYLFKTADDQTFTWTALSTGSAPRRYAAPRTSALSASGLEVDKSEFPNVMNLIATISDHSSYIPQGNFVVAAFSGEECRGISTMIDGTLFLTIYGSANEPINLSLYDESGNVFDIIESFTFRQQTLHGSRTAPLALTIDEATEIAHNLSAGTRPVAVTYFTADGKLVNVNADSATPVLLLEKTRYSDGTTVVRKIVR